VISLFLTLACLASLALSITYTFDGDDIHGGTKGTFFLVAAAVSWVLLYLRLEP